MTARHGVSLGLVAILVMAAGLRLWNYDFDPLEGGNPLYHDAWAKFIMANKVAQGDDQPDHYKQPALLVYTGGFLLRVSAFFGHTDRDHLWRLMVLYMITCSVLTVALTYPISMAVFDRRDVALPATAFAAVMPASVIGSRYIKEDVPLALFVNLSVLFLLLVVKRRRLWWYLPAGVCVGLSVATKYSAAGMLLFFVLAHCFVVFRAGKGNRLPVAVSPWFIGGLIVVPLVFLVVNPYVVPDWPLFRETLVAQISYAAQGHNDGTAIRGYQYLWMFYLKNALLPGMTLPLLAASIVGAVRAAGRKEAPSIFLLAWVLFFYLSIENSPAKPFPFFVRYLHSLFPALCVFAAFLFCGLRERCGGRRTGRCLVAVAAAGCILVPLLRSVLVTSGAADDTRMVATEWINANLEEGSRIYLDDVFYSPRPAMDRFDVNYRKRMYHASLETLQKREVDYVVLNSFRTQRYEVCRDFSEEAARIHDYYVRLMDTGRPVGKFTPRFACQTYGFHNPTVVVYRMPWAK